jgi:alkylation response protein AidB-like acyl-CoA dehydrogenase
MIESLTSSDEREEFRQSLRGFLAARLPFAKVREAIEPEQGFDREIWRLMAEQLGLQGLAIPEAFDGAGFGQSELATVFEQLGYALAPVPFLATVGLASNAIMLCGDGGARQELLPLIAAGECVAALAHSATGEDLDADGGGVSAVKVDAGWKLSGRSTLVIDGLMADLLLVVASTPEGVSLFLVEDDAAGLHRRRLDAMDHTRPLAEIALESTPARLLGDPGSARPGLARTLDLALVNLAAEQVGVAQRCLDMAVEYALAREQFGRPIGGFQAVKHLCADVLLEVESSRSMALHAATVAESGSDGLALVASMAKCYCSEAAYHAAAVLIQVLGGIGYTWEADAHFYFKRARSSAALLGGLDFHRDRVAEIAGV